MFKRKGIVRGRMMNIDGIVETPAVAAMSLEQFRTALNALPHGTVIIGSDGVEVWRSRAVHGLIGSSSQIDELNEVIATVAQRATRGVAQRQAFELAGPPVRALEIRAVPMVNGGGLVVIEDLTERVLIDRVRTDFVANISHELKTPIGALSVLAESIRGELAEGDEVLKRLADRMVGETTRVARIIDDLLELASIEFVGTSERRERDVAQLVREVVSRFTGAAAAKNVSLNLVLGDGELMVPVDSRQLATAVGNLVENAIKYTDPHGSVTVEAKLTGGWLTIIVHDTGMGIPTEHLDRIFERFYRVDDARSRATGGTGLGLAIVRHVATNHGGEVNVRSQEGEGSTFTLRLPLSLG